MRKRHSVLRLAVSAATVLVVTVLAVDPALAQSPKRGGVFRVPLLDVPNLDPHLTQGFLTQTPASLVYGQLVRFPAGPEQTSASDDRILPDLAEKWEYTSPTTVVFTLRKGVRFHRKPPVNGREVTGRRRQVLARPLPVTVDGPRSSGRGSVHRRRRPLHRAHRPQRALRPAPELSSPPSRGVRG